MKTVLTLSFLILAYSPLFSQIITVGNGGDYSKLEDAVSNIMPGDTVIILDGVYSDGSQFIENLNGTATAPILIKAANEHEAIFQGGTTAIQLSDCSYITIDGLVIEQQTGNGINIDDGGSYDSPAHHISIINCLFRDMNVSGNHDLLKLSGLDDFLVKNCQFIDGSEGGSGVDMVGCHHGVIEDCLFDNAGVSGIQNKGGTQFIRIQRNVFKDMSQRALNLGGNTGLQFFRPPLPSPIVDAFEAADLDVFSNIFIGSWAPIAYVGAVRVKVYNNTFYQPENWVIRILQETTEDGFLPCSDNEFINNVIYLESDLTEVNIGSNTDAESFTFSNNLWHNASSSNWSPNLPVDDPNQIIADPLFTDPDNEVFDIQMTSPSIGQGMVLDAPETDFFDVPFYTSPSIGAIEGSDLVSTWEEQDQARIHLFPNPAHNLLHIQAVEEGYSISIKNIHQQTIVNLPSGQSDYQVPLTSFSSGIYLIQLKHLENKTISTLRFIKI